MNTARIGASEGELENLKAFGVRQSPDGEPLTKGTRFLDQLRGEPCATPGA